ncbi:uncharacterized protein [Montipora capricornis]|uniref:uncharacterized protein n=1 Tax=Montipora capricornis TaxID=246305 RepID=UPI0035F17EFD
MSCGLYRSRYSKARRFLYEKEVQELLECAENEKRRIISTLAIDDQYRASISRVYNLRETFSQLLLLGAGVCRIEVFQTNGVSHIGSGFYFGDGWILTSAHVLRNRDNVNRARFIFFSLDHEISFEARQRRAIIHRILPVGKRPDYHNRDITLVKLGVQYTYGRKKVDLEEWEIDEQQLLDQSRLFDFSSLVQNAFTSSGEVEFSIKPTDPLTAIHFGGRQDARKKFVFDIPVQEVYKQLPIKVVNFSVSIDCEASGCPVVQRVRGNWVLVGVLFGGVLHESEESSVVTVGQALLWNEQILHHIRAGQAAVEKMSCPKPYNIFIPFSERAQLLLETGVKEAADLAVQHRILIL